MPDLSRTVVFRAVAGAVRNALDGHPQWVVPRNFARSVAKRAAGTLAGMNPGTALAAARQPGQRQNWGLTTGSERVRATLAVGSRALSRLRAAIQPLILDAYKSGDQARFLDLCTVARILKREIARDA